MSSSSGSNVANKAMAVPPISDQVVPPNRSDPLPTAETAILGERLEDDVPEEMESTSGAGEPAAFPVPTNPHPADQSRPASASAVSGPSRKRAVDLSIIAETEEDKSSLIIAMPNGAPARSAIAISSAQPPQSQPMKEQAAESDLLNVAQSPKPVSSKSKELSETKQIVDARTISLNAGSTASAPVPVPLPPPAPAPTHNVRSSWLKSALSAGPHPGGPQRTSDGNGTTRQSGVYGPTGPSASHRLSTVDFPVMRKSLAPPGVLAKRKSGDGVVQAEEADDAEKRPGKVARVDATSTAAAVSSTSLPRVGPPILHAAKSPVLGMASSVQTVQSQSQKPAFERQVSHEAFPRPPSAASQNAQSTFSLPQHPILDTPITERPTSDIDRVTKALNDMRKQQEAKDAAKQKASLHVSAAGTAANAAPAVPSTTRPATFFRNLGSSFSRSLGIGAHRDAEEEERKRQQAREEEAETERKAREEMNEIMRRMEKPDSPVPLPSQTQIVSSEKLREEERDGGADELDSDEEAEVNESIELDEAVSPAPSPARLPVQAPARPPAQKAATPPRLPRQPFLSTTPQGSPTRLHLQRSPAQDSAPQPVQTSAKARTASPAKATVQDRIKSLNENTETTLSPKRAMMQASRTPLLFSPGRSGARKSDAIEIDAQEPPHTAQDKTKATVNAAVSRSVSPEHDFSADMEEEMADDEEEEILEQEPAAGNRKAAGLTKSASVVSLATSTSSTGANGSLFSHASTIAKKVVGIKPSIGQVKSVQAAEAASKRVSSNLLELIAQL